MYQEHEEDYRQQPQAQAQFFPGFPFFPPTPGPDINLRVRRLEEQQFRMQQEIDSLNRRVSRLERRVGVGGPGFPWG